MRKPSEQKDRHRSWRLLSREAVVYYTLNLDGSIRAVEGPFETLFGHKSSDVVGKDQRELFDPNSFPTVERHFREHVAGESEFALNELRVVSKEGDPVPVLATTIPIRNSQGAIVGAQGIIYALGDSVATPPVGRPIRRTPRTVEALTPRQTEVLGLLSQGLSTREMAYRLVVTEETVRHHIRAILRAFGAHSRVEAVVRALRVGVISVSSAAWVANRTDPPPQDSRRKRLIALGNGDNKAEAGD